MSVPWELELTTPKGRVRMAGKAGTDAEALTSLDLGLDMLNRTARKHSADIARLVPLARELAAKAGQDGVCVSDLRVTATQRGLLGASHGRSLSYLGAVLKAAGLVPTDRYRRSDVPASHGNPHRVFVLP